MFWYIQSDVNNGYPALSSWKPEWESGWSSDITGRYPDYIWRIKSGVNKGYPWLYPWFQQESYEEHEMIIGGSQSNYPTGFTDSDLGGIENDFDDLPMPINATGSVGGINAGTAIIGGTRVYALNGLLISGITQAFNNTSVFDTAAIDLISKMYGANIFDCIVSAKVFPFDLSQLWIGDPVVGHSIISGTEYDMLAYGRFYLEHTTGSVTIREKGYGVLGSTGYYDFPAIEVNPLQAWEIENIDFSIYLPYSGTYPLDIRGESVVFIRLYVDVISGTGMYHVFINGQLQSMHRAMLGADVPINMNAGRTQANMVNSVVGGLMKGATLATGLIGSAGAYGASKLAENVSPFTEHYAMSSPSIGGSTEFLCYPFPRVIAKIPKMFKSGYGYKETLGWNRSTTYVRLAECSGFVKCKNYKTDIIVATEDEKLEIERLMNEGVFI